MNAESPRARQLRAVREYMLAHRTPSGDPKWTTLRSLSEQTGAPEASASARIRDLRKPGHVVQKQRLLGGQFPYRVTAKPAKGRK